MTNKYRDIVVVVALVVIGSIAIIGQVPGIVRAILALPMVVILPGYAFTAALFYNHPLNLPEKIVLSVGLSLILTILGGFVLDAGSSGLIATEWVIWLDGTTLFACVVTWALRYQQPPVAKESGKYGFNARESLLLGLAVLIGLGAVLVARTGAFQQHTPAFTQLSMVVASDHTVHLEITSFEYQELEYRLELTDGSHPLNEFTAIKLIPNQKWVGNYTLPTTLNTGILEADLYRVDDPQSPYRTVRYYITPQKE